MSSAALYIWVSPLVISPTTTPYGRSGELVNVTRGFYSRFLISLRDFSVRKRIAHAHSKFSSAQAPHACAVSLLHLIYVRTRTFRVPHAFSHAR